MNIVNKLTLRSLKQNKRRTLVTIIGVVISVAMITAVATLSESFLNLMIKQTIAMDGEWHYGMSDVDGDQLKAIKEDKATKSVVVSRDRGYAHLEGSDNRSKPFLFIAQYNAAGFEHFPMKLREGRFPAAENEIMISDEIADTAKVELKIGDTLNLEVGQRLGKRDGEIVRLGQNTPLLVEEDKIVEDFAAEATESYTIVGIMERPDWEQAWAPGYTVVSFLDEQLIGADKTVKAQVIMKEVKSSLYGHAKQLAEEIGIDKNKLKFNNGLLRYYGISNTENVRSMMLSLAAIIMAIIIVGSVSLIYNAFAISVSERSRYLGMLSSVGATKRQKRNSVFFEGAVIGLISIPIGFACGLLGIWITFKFINSTIQGALELTETLTVTVTPMTIAIACAVSILTIFISTYIPARRASRISAIDAIRQSTDVKLTGKAVRTSKLIRKLFGIEAEIGLKNLKRNKRKYQATVFSLVISIVLFLSVSYFTDTLKKSMVLSQDGINFDIKVSLYNDEKADTIKKIGSLPTISDYNAIQEFYMTSRFAQEKLPVQLKGGDSMDERVGKDGGYLYDLNVYALDDNSLQAYAKEVGVDWKAYTDVNNPAAIVVDTIVYKDEIASKYVEMKAVNLNVGEPLDLEYHDYDTNKDIAALQVKVGTLTDKQPMGAFSPGIGGLNIVVSDRLAAQLYNEEYEPRTSTIMYINSSDPMKTQQQIEEQKHERISVYNIYQARERERQMLLLMQVFTYGFISLITAISVANIFNTISTSISLRKREFAMLKSIGMTPKGFNKMINYESIFYGVKSLLYGLPLSGICMYLIYWSTSKTFSFTFELPWVDVIEVIAIVFLIVITAMMYSSSKVKRENIIDALKQENI